MLGRLYGIGSPEKGREWLNVFFCLFLGMMVIQNSFDIGELVYLKTDKEQSPRIIYCIKVYKSENIYELACGTTTSSHYEFELSKEVNVLMSTTN